MINGFLFQVEKRRFVLSLWQEMKKTADEEHLAHLWGL
jgi:hypothetical protein